MMFSMSRDRHLPGGALWGHVNPTFKTPANAAIAVGVLAALPILVIGRSAASRVDRATGLIYLSYLLQHRRAARPVRGWPHSRRGSTSGAGASRQHPALLYGGDADQHRHLAGPGLFGELRRRGRASRTRRSTRSSSRSATRSRDAGVADLRDARRRCSSRRLYYVVSVRGRAATSRPPTRRPARP
jgi:hypothetical protein